MRANLVAAVIAGSFALSGAANAQPVDKKEFNVVGTWNFLTNWQKLEQPFWVTDLPAASGGNLTGNTTPIT